MDSTTSALGQEWAILQNNFEAYEKSCLFIKLTSLALFTAAMTVGLSLDILGTVVALLWLQEGIVRTSQSRLGVRILRLEGLLRSGSAVLANSFQLHTEWLAARPGTVALLQEYVSNACRPTVAFPHAIQILVVFIVATLQG